MDRILLIADLLLGAAYADESLDGREENAVRDRLRELLDVESLPADIQHHIDDFPARKFDMRATADDFATDPPIKKRKLLELVASVRDADDEIDFREDEYMTALAKALGMSEADYSDLTLDYEIEDLRSSFEELRRAPD